MKHFLYYNPSYYYYSKRKKRRTKYFYDIKSIFDFAIVIFFVFHYSLEENTVFDFYFHHFLYLGEAVDWNKEKTVKFSYENMSIHHNSTCVVNKENEHSKYLLYTGKLNAKVYCPEDSHIISNSTYTIIPNIIVGRFCGFGTLTQYIDIIDPPRIPYFRVASYTGHVSQVCDDLIATGSMWTEVFGHFVLDVLVTMLFIIYTRMSIYIF